jgi:hypothetical protein
MISILPLPTQCELEGIRIATPGTTHVSLNKVYAITCNHLKNLSITFNVAMLKTGDVCHISIETGP